MSEYHTAEAMAERLEARRRFRAIPKGPLFYWHVALMSEWEPIVREQLALLQFLGHCSVFTAVLGNHQDYAKFLSMTKGRGIEVERYSADLHNYETETLQILWEDAKNYPDAGIVYFHTKGVSNPADRWKPTWRRVMQRYILAEWEYNLAQLAEYDMVGTNWQNSGDLPHFQGNFWVARGDWIAHLMPPIEHRKLRPGEIVCGHPWERMHAEMWLGSEPYHHRLSRDYEDREWWRGEDVFSVPYEIPGFSYHR